MVLEQRTYREMKFYKSTKQGTKKKEKQGNKSIYGEREKGKTKQKKQ